MANPSTKTMEKKKMTEPKLRADGTATIDVPMGNKIKHLTFDYTETATLAAPLNYLTEHNKEDPDAV